MAEPNLKATTSDGELGDLLTCPICQLVCVQPRILSCQHIACTKCINDWIQAKEGQLWCPECNQQRVLPDGGAECLPHSFRLNDVCGILREKSEFEDDGRNCKMHPGKALTMICYECQKPVCDSCPRKNHAGHLCADAKRILAITVERKGEQVRGSQDRINQLKQELKKSKEDGLDVMRDFKQRFDLAYQHLSEEMEKIYKEKANVLKGQQRELEAFKEGMNSIGQMVASQESIDINLTVEQLKSFPQEDYLIPKTTSFFKVEMVDNFMKMLFSDGETKCGKIMNTEVPVPNKSVIEVVSNELIAGSDIELRLVLNDHKGRRVMTEKSDILSVEVCTVDNQTVSLEAQKVEGGHFQVSYTPSHPGWYVIKATVYKKMIRGSPMQLKVTPRWLELEKIIGTSQFVQPHDVLKVGDNLVIVDKSVVMINRSGKIIQTFVNNDWYFYPYSVAMRGQFYYVAAMKGQVVIRYDANGKEVHRFGGDVLKKPTGIAVDNEGNIYVADSQLSKILSFHPNGQFKEYVGSEDGSGQTMTLNSPWFIKLNSRGHLVIADFENRRVQVLNVNTGHEVLSILVKHEGRSMYCRGVDIDRHDNIYVSCREDKRGSTYECILVYSRDGTFLNLWEPEESLSWVRGVHIVKEAQFDVLYVVNSGSTPKSIRCFVL